MEYSHSWNCLHYSDYEVKITLCILQKTVRAHWPKRQANRLFSEPALLTKEIFTWCHRKPFLLLDYEFGVWFKSLPWNFVSLSKTRASWVLVYCEGRDGSCGWFRLVSLHSTVLILPRELRWFLGMNTAHRIRFCFQFNTKFITYSNFIYRFTWM